MSALPEFTTAPAWLDYNDESYGDRRFSEVLSVVGLAPWTPLDTAEGHVKRIDRDKLADILSRAYEAWAARVDSGLDEPLTEYESIADAVLAALPELMGGGER